MEAWRTSLLHSKPLGVQRELRDYLRQASWKMFTRFPRPARVVEGAVCGWAESAAGSATRATGVGGAGGIALAAAGASLRSMSTRGAVSVCSEAGGSQEADDSGVCAADFRIEANDGSEGSDGSVS